MSAGDARAHSLARRACMVLHDIAFLWLGVEINSLPQKFAMYLLFVVRVWIMEADRVLIPLSFSPHIKLRSVPC